MILLAMLLPAALPAALSAQVVPHPSLGTAEGRCRPNEPGPAFLVTLTGLKDRMGSMRVELYPANDTDFLADDAVLINAGKAFRRVTVDVPKSGPAVLCIRAPSAGVFALSILHDRDNNRKLSLSLDGVGFPGNPNSLGPSKPKVAIARANTNGGATPITVRLLYRRGLFSFGPLR